MKSFRSSRAPAAPPRRRPRCATPGRRCQHLETVPLDLAFTDSAGRAVKLGDYFGGSGRSSSRSSTTGARCSAPERPRRAPRRRKARRNYDLVTVSMTRRSRRREAPATSGARRRRLQTTRSWPFLTGSRRESDALGRGGLRLQLPSAVRRSPTPRWSSPLSRAALPTSTASPSPGPRLALAEAGAGSGVSFERILLTCFRYDPAAGATTCSSSASSTGPRSSSSPSGLLFVLWRLELRGRAIRRSGSAGRQLNTGKIAGEALAALSGCRAGLDDRRERRPPPTS